MTWNDGTPPAWFRRAYWGSAWSKRNGVHYVGDDVVLDWYWLGDPAKLLYKRCATGFEFGVDGQPLLASDPEFRTPNGNVGGTPTYDSAHAYGDLSMRVGAAAVSDYLEYGINGDVLDQYGRMYLYATQNPAGTAIVFWNPNCQIGVTSTGKLDLGGGRISVASIALNQWVRIEWRTKWGYPAQADSVYEVRLYNSADSTVATETLHYTNCFAQQSNNRAVIGNVGNSWGTDFWIDNVVAGVNDWPGPYDPYEQPTTPVTYTVRDYFGKTVTQGTIDQGTDFFLLPPPSGGWQPGWYRVYLTGSETDANFADSYGVTNFCVIKPDAHFVTMPAATTVGGYNGEGPDLVMKGVMGLGTSRLIINDLASPAAEIATAQQELAVTQAYWTDTGTPDSERSTREPWCTFPNCDGSPTQLAGVTAVVTALYPDCKYYEGPENEPNPNDPTVVTKMQAFQAAVHAGNANAKAIGPCAVEIPPQRDWTGFLANGGGSYCDEISFHAYNAVTNGNLNLGRNSIQTFKDTLNSYGLSGKQLWQTESVGPGIIPYGIYHPRRARKALMETLLFEQMGVPRERNNWWYDTSHGFWDYPAWLENADGSLEPSAVMGRVLAEETWGKPYDSAVDFGPLGNAMYIGNVYMNVAGDSTVVLMATSYMTGASVSLTITGTTDPVTVVDGFGREKQMPPSRGRITIPMTDVPAYVRLPVGASASVYRVNGWSPLGQPDQIGADATTMEIDGVSRPALSDNAWLTNSASGAGLATPGAVEPPSVATLLWVSDRTFERVILWSGMCWQGYGALVSFEIETYDGATWTTRKTVTKETPSYFDFGSDTSTSACFRETFWDEQWIFDVELDAPVTARGVRVNVTDASYGGEPLSAPDFGQGNTIKAYVLEEIAVADGNRYAGAV